MRQLPNQSHDQIVESAHNRATYNLHYDKANLIILRRNKWKELSTTK